MNLNPKIFAKGNNSDVERVPTLKVWNVNTWSITKSESGGARRGSKIFQQKNFCDSGKVLLQTI